MIYLAVNKRYFILIDNDCGEFGGNQIFESLLEVKEQFNDWGNQDELGEEEDIVLNTWTIGECLPHWNMSMQEYTGSGFTRCEGSNEMDFIK